MMMQRVSWLVAVACFVLPAAAQAEGRTYHCPNRTISEPTSADPSAPELGYSNQRLTVYHESHLLRPVPRRRRHQFACNVAAVVAAFPYLLADRVRWYCREPELVLEGAPPNTTEQACSSHFTIYAPAVYSHRAVAQHWDCLEKTRTTHPDAAPGPESQTSTTCEAYGLALEFSL
jgi:hypothetical protein